MEENKNPEKDIPIETTAVEKPKKQLSRGAELFIAAALLLAGVIALVGCVYCLVSASGVRLLYIDSAAGARLGYWRLYGVAGILLAGIGAVLLVHGLKRAAPATETAAEPSPTAPESAQVLSEANASDKANASDSAGE